MVGHFHAGGTPREVAEQMARYKEQGHLDGFIVLPQTLPDDIRIFAAEVIPELARIGARNPASGGSATLRERLGLPVPAQ